MLPAAEAESFCGLTCRIGFAGLGAAINVSSMNRMHRAAVSAVTGSREPRTSPNAARIRRLLQDVARVGLEYQPYPLSRLQAQRPAGAWGQVDGKHYAAIDFGDDRYVLLV